MKDIKDTLVALVVGIVVWLGLIYCVERYLPKQSIPVYMCLGLLCDGIAKAVGALAAKAIK